MFNKEELFAILIAVIFINESIVKLFDIRKKYKFTNNPYDYKDFHEKTNDTNCFRCVYSGNNSISINVDLNSIYNERDVNKNIITNINNIFLINYKLRNSKV